MRGVSVRVRGIVQGVGFRPFVYGLARRYALTGWVRNTSAGVEIELNGPADQLDAFIRDLREQPPPLARVDEISVAPATPNGYTEFTILESHPQPGDFIPVSPDTAICPDCRRELFDPADRRFRYPFINCTNCGPRFTIIRDIPYDRPQTTMAGFALCPECANEYQNPLDRRFHAQPVACSACGPRIFLKQPGQPEVSGEEALRKARQTLQNGLILAIKGLGGFHLACDAANASAVDLLRGRKKRSDKPFALMAFDLPTIQKFARVSPDEAALLQSRQSPVVLLAPHSLPPARLAAAVAPGQARLGFMLPYTPLHLLLLEPAPGFPEALVMTSGNLSEEPIAYRDEDGQARLAPLADAFLLHDRPIHIRVDDSVVTLVDGAPYLVRRARGYAPNPTRVAPIGAPIFGAGAELKNTFCLARDEYAFLSHYIGDLENYETLQSYEEAIEHYQRLFKIQPAILAADLHPDLLASRYAQERASREALPLVQVQHHHAHLAACLADQNRPLDEPAIGLIFDGVGYGLDGTSWGGEVLVGSAVGFERFAHLEPVPMPGGDQAVRKPARMALAHLRACGLDWEPDLPPTAALCYEERTVIRAQLEKNLNAPLTSSMGRLLDAAAALIGVRQQITYEGQAAIEMEAIAAPDEPGFYPMPLEGGQIRLTPFWEALLADWLAGVSRPTLAARVHNSIVENSLAWAQAAAAHTGLRLVALSGGVWQNQYLLARALPRLRSAGFEPLIHRSTPPNDGCIALGQVMVAAAALKNGRFPSASN